MATSEGVSVTQHSRIGHRVRYEIAMWRGLWHCIRHGHLIVGLGRAKDNAPYYCWTCFWNYPYTCWISYGQWARNAIGGLIR